MVTVKSLKWYCVHGNLWDARTGDRGAGSASVSLTGNVSPELCHCWTAVGAVLMDYLDSGETITWTN